MLAAAAEAELSPAALARAAGVSSGVVYALIADGVLAEDAARGADRLPGARPRPCAARAERQPGRGARRAGGAWSASGGFAVALLDGVTGSGKTEVYLEAVAAALRRDPDAQVLILLPEIALTQAVIDRFAERFGAEPAAWHSGDARRRAAAGSGRRSRAASAASWSARARRSSCRSRSLRLIVVDEEHDGSYKQEDGFIYQARDLAVARAKIEEAPVILASATPSLETPVERRDRPLPLAAAGDPPRRRGAAGDRR